ncbi:J domain-containing protein [Methylocella silvestris]|uniref:Molecular chaperone DnaJ n=1 Tax=Methylocella silvestris TaxID=199596 RepID=A0A2J7TJF5_METSI|nr:J domain-containing protein [Methylocella silvestris]PNG26903.1 molecular chaperone DnaJ [Methylocella silvestris]
MNLNSRIFDRIRVKREPKAAVQQNQPRCDYPGCSEPGGHRAPMGRLREGQYFSFCLDHVREYNATYNYFNGMSAEDVALYQRDALVGHRPTWSMGSMRGEKGFREDGEAAGPDALGMTSPRSYRRAAAEPSKPRLGLAAVRALDTLGLDATADTAAVKTRFKDLVKRLHPDANSGDRSNEDRLREIIRAYKYLKSVRCG